MLGINSRVYVPSCGMTTVKQLLDDGNGYLLHNAARDGLRDEYWVCVDTTRVPELAHIGDAPGWRLSRLAFESLSRQGYRTVEE